MKFRSGRFQVLITQYSHPFRIALSKVRTRMPYSDRAGVHSPLRIAVVQFAPKVCLGAIEELNS